jgi:hypothetical protein
MTLRRRLGAAVRLCGTRWAQDLATFYRLAPGEALMVRLTRPCDDPNALRVDVRAARAGQGRGRRRSVTGV